MNCSRHHMCPKFRLDNLVKLRLKIGEGGNDPICSQSSIETGKVIIFCRMTAFAFQKLQPIKINHKKEPVVMHTILITEQYHKWQHATQCSIKRAHEAVHIQGSFDKSLVNNDCSALNHTVYAYIVWQYFQVLCLAFDNTDSDCIDCVMSILNLFLLN